MARAKSEGNGRIDRLEEAMAAAARQLAILLQSQAELAQNQIAFTARMAEIDARIAETNRLNDERFGRFEERFSRIEAILIEHSRILQNLPDAIRDKIGFKIPPQQSSE